MALNPDILEKHSINYAKEICFYLGVNYETLMSKVRKRPYPDVVKVVSMIMSRKGYTTLEVAAALKRNHSTVIIAERQCRTLLYNDKAFYKTYYKILRYYGVV